MLIVIVYDGEDGSCLLGKMRYGLIYFLLVRTSNEE